MPEAQTSTGYEIVPATLDQQPVLANMLELYAYDFTGFYHVDLGPDGRFGYEQLPLYWTEPGRHPFLIKIDGQLAGFALIKQGSEITGNPDTWDMTEFFIMRAYRRRGFGTSIAHEFWKMYPGTWELRVLESNVWAQSFWVRAMKLATGKVVEPVSMEKNGDHWKLYTFESNNL